MGGVVVAVLDRVAVLVGDFGVGDRAVARLGRQRAADAVAVVGEGHVRVGPFERRDAFLEAAEHHRRVGRDRRPVAHLVDRRRDRGRAVVDRLALQAFERELRVDRVVRVGRRADDVAGAEVGVLVVGDREDFLVVLAEVEGLRRRFIDFVGGDPLFEGGDQGERLDRGSRLAVAEGRQVEGLGVEVGAADHRLDPGVVVVEDDHRGGRRRVAEVAVDRFFGRSLQAQVERRLDLQPAEERFRRPVAIDQLLAQPGGEVGRLRVEGGGLDVAGGGKGLRGCLPGAAVR